MLKKALLIIKHTLDIIVISIRDGLSFIKYTEILPTRTSKIEQIQFRLTIGVHSLEKGLSFKNKKERFGEAKAIKQLKTLLKYLQKGYPTNNYAIYETIAILEAYIQYKESVNESIPSIKHLLNECKTLIENCSKNYCDAGMEVLTKSELTCNDPQIYIDFINKTRSIRNFDYTNPVEEKDIISAISISKMAPSACNRQPVKVYYSMDPDKNKIISKIIPGNIGFENEIRNFLIVTSSKNYFSLQEYNQWYVNGGIFLGYLRLALHILNLGSCIFQWALYADEKQLRAICTIPQSEVIIAIIGIGHYANESYCIKAQRKSTEEYISKF